MRCAASGGTLKVMRPLPGFVRRFGRTDVGGCGLADREDLDVLIEVPHGLVRIDLCLRGSAAAADRAGRAVSAASCWSSTTIRFTLSPGTRRPATPCTWSTDTVTATWSTGIRSEKVHERRGLIDEHAVDDDLAGNEVRQRDLAIEHRGVGDGRRRTELLRDLARLDELVANGLITRRALGDRLLDDEHLDTLRVVIRAVFDAVDVVVERVRQRWLR